MLEVRVVLDLVHRWHDLGSLEDCLQVALHKVGHADRPSFSRSLDLLHLSPGGLKLTVRLGKERGMDQIPCVVSIWVGEVRENLQVNIIETEFL